MNKYVSNIRESGQTIYDEMLTLDDGLYIPNIDLELLLKEGLVGINLNGLALRTRSKVVKEKICDVLGYPIPKSFKKTQPRFYSQNFDIYTQKSFNVQIWNEDIDPLRRYIFIQVNGANIITNVKLITGDQLVILDRTGTLTTKYQATMNNLGESNLLSSKDTKRIRDICSQRANLIDLRPNEKPKTGVILPISDIFNRLCLLEGKTLPHLDFLQERNRGAELHKLVCEKLGFSTYEDDGAFPDIMNQLLEIKLQTSPTIDLGLHLPSSEEILFDIDGICVRTKDIRYAIIDAEVIQDYVRINRIYLVNGKHFLEHFPLFGGKIKNSKLQIPLPTNFFNG